MFRKILLVVSLGSAMAVMPTNYGAVSSLLDKPITPCLEWTGGSFEWPCPSTKSLYKSSGKYISKNVIATRAQIVGDDVFVALPRYKSGVPATLARTNFKKGQCSATLKPFPCWASQEEGNCQSLQSVVDIVVDKNDIVWALDVGVVNTLETPVRKCPPKVVAISAKTGKVLKTIALDELVSPTSRLQYLVVDYAGDNRCYVYISDAAQRSIIVYDVQASRGFRVILPKAVTAGCPKRDVLYLALARKSCGTSVLYFTYLSSKNLFLIKTEYLRSGNAQGRVTGELQHFHARTWHSNGPFENSFRIYCFISHFSQPSVVSRWIDVGVKPKKLVIIGTDNGSAIFFRYEGQAEVFRWDVDSSFEEANFRAVYRCQTCQLATHAVADYKRGTMRVLESNFPDFMHNTVGCGAVQQLTVMKGCW